MRFFLEESEKRKRWRKTKAADRLRGAGAGADSSLAPPVAPWLRGRGEAGRSRSVSSGGSARSGQNAGAQRWRGSEERERETGGPALHTGTSRGRGKRRDGGKGGNAELTWDGSSSRSVKPVRLEGEAAAYEVWRSARGRKPGHRPGRQRAAAAGRPRPGEEGAQPAPAAGRTQCGGTCRPHGTPSKRKQTADAVPVPSGWPAEGRWARSKD